MVLYARFTYVNVLPMLMFLRDGSHTGLRRVSDGSQTGLRRVSDGSQTGLRWVSDGSQTGLSYDLIM